MNNYDYGLNLFTENSNKKIIEHIRKKSCVLEFGPAHGRLTRYLFEVLECKVDIVEYNEIAGRNASKYARNALIGDKEGNIESYTWKQKLVGNKYDYIIFADVLEHLRNSNKVLRECSIFLKNEGYLICSVPNIAHSSVI